MHEHESPMLKSFESRLREWKPAIDSSGRTRMLFQAGRRRGQRDFKLNWSSAAITVVALATGIGLGVMTKPSGPQIVDSSRFQEKGPADGQDFLAVVIRDESLVDPQSYVAMTRSFAENAELDPLKLTLFGASAQPRDVLTPRSTVE